MVLSTWTLHDTSIYKKLNSISSRYYTFGHEFGKYWRAVNDEILHDFTLEQEIAFPFYVNMAWDTTKKIDVHLAGCGV